MSELPAQSSPAPFYDKLNRASANLQEEIKALTASAAGSETPKVGSETGTETGEKPPPQADAASDLAVATSVLPSTAEDPPAVVLARAVIRRAVDQALAEHCVDVSLARKLAAADGIEFGVDDLGRATYQKDGGEEVVMTRASLAAAFDKWVMKPPGAYWEIERQRMAGASVPVVAPTLDEALADQRIWDQNPALWRRKLAEQKRKEKS